MPSYKATRSGHSLSIASQKAAQILIVKAKPEPQADADAEQAKQAAKKAKKWRTRNQDAERGVDHKTLTCGAGNVKLVFGSKSEVFTPEAYAEYRSWKKEPVFDAVAYELMRQERDASY
jgi:hypothetical protein